MHRDDTSDDQGYATREVFIQYGLALFHASVLEVALWTITTITDVPGTSTAAWGQAWDQEWGAMRPETFELVLVALEPHLDGDSGLPEGLREAMSLRNRLVHRFFWEYAGAFGTEAGRDAMLADLFRAVRHLEDLQPRLTTASRRFAKASGVSDEEMERRKARRQAELKRPWEE